MTQFARHLFPGFLLAGIAVVLFCVAPFSGFDRLAESLLFEVRLSASAAGDMRLYYSRDGAVAQGEFASAVLKAGVQSARFVIPADTYRTFVIVAPADSGSVEIGGAQVFDLAGVELAHFEKGRFLPMEGGTHWQIRCAPPLVLRSSLDWSIWQCAALLAVLGTVVSVLLWALAARLEKLRLLATAGFARGWQHALQRPAKTLLATACVAVLVSCYPVAFCGQSFVSANNRVICLYPSFPTIPGSPAGPIENPKLADIGAMLLAHLPYSIIEHRAIFEDHELPLRNRANSCGVPLLGQGQSMIGDPLHWIPLVAGGASWAWDVKFVLAKILFAFGIGLLVQAAVGRLGIAVVLAASSAFIGFFAYRFNHAAIFSLSYAPWVLFAWLKIADAAGWRGAIRWVALLILANWMELNSGTAKEASMLILTMNAAGALALVLRREILPGRAKKLAVAAAGLLIFLLLSAPCWLVFLDALSQAWTSSNLPRAWQVKPGLLPGLFDDLFYRQTVPREYHTNPSANFLLLIGVLWALVHARRLGADRIFVALALAAMAAGALVFGVVPPGLLVWLPFVGNILHIDNTFSCVLLVLLFPLAGYGLRVCRERMPEAGWRGDWVITLLFAGALGAAFLGSIQAGTRPPDKVLETVAPTPMSGFFLGYAAALFLAVALLPWLARRLFHARAWTLPNVLLCALCLFALHFRHGMYGATKFDAYVMNPRDRMDLQAPSPMVGQLKAQQLEPARVAGFGSVLTPGFGSVIGLDGIGGPDALLSAHYRELVEAARLPIIWGWMLTVEKGTTPSLLPFHELLNLRYYLGMPEASPREVAGLRRIGTLDLDLYESPGVWPRAFFTDTLMRYQTPEDFAQMVAKGDRRPFAAMQENSAPPGALPSVLAARQVVPAAGYRLTTNTTTFVIDAPSRGLAVLTETFEEGNFRVTVNGTPTPYLRVNHAFCGVPIPQAGHFIVRFEYRPRRLTLALWLAAAGLALLTAAVAWLRLSRPVPAA